MRRAHFDELSPVCVVCQVGGMEHRLELSQVFEADSTSIWQGILRCSSGGCRREYPIIDGIPVLLRDVRGYLSANVGAVTRRRDLSAGIESLLGDCCGSLEGTDSERQQLSSYCWNHYGDSDPAEHQPPLESDQVATMLRRSGFGQSLGSGGASLEAGCGVGRTVFELGRRLGGLCLGVDVHFGMLRKAQEVLRYGELSWYRRRVGLSYEARRFRLRFPGQERVDFWVCDGAALPFSPGTFGSGVSLNLLDSIGSPVDHLCGMQRVLAEGAEFLVGTPFDWTPAVTDVTQWIGGHSDRSDDGGCPVQRFREVLASLPEASTGKRLEILSHATGVPWGLRLHDRGMVNYACELFLLRVGGTATVV